MRRYCKDKKISSGKINVYVNVLYIWQTYNVMMWSRNRVFCLLGNISLADVSRSIVVTFLITFYFCIVNKDNKQHTLVTVKN